MTYEPSEVRAWAHEAGEHGLGQVREVGERHREGAGGGDGVHVVGAQGVPGVFRVAAGLFAVQGDADGGGARAPA